MRLQLSLLSLSVTAAILYLSPLEARGEENATGKVSDNLYEISKQHIKDPFRWPSIWRLTPQAGDPGGMQSWKGSREYNYESETKVDDPAPAKAKADWKRSEERRTQAYMKKMAPLMPSVIEQMPPQDVSPRTVANGPVRHYLSQSIVLTTPFIAEPSGGGYFPRECKVRYSGSNESEILQLFEEVVLSVGQDGGVKTGDLFRTYQVGDAYRSYASGRGLGHLVETNGIVEVMRVGPKSSVARLVKCFGTISRDSRATPLTPPEEVAATAYNPATDGKLAAQVVWVTSSQQFPQPYSYAIVDRGSAKGYRAGDMVLFFNRNEGKMTDKVLGDGIVVHVGDKTATILIRDLYPGIINRGDYTMVIQSAVL
ncbi:MAG: LysM protein [Fibrobacteres bacterium]|nr:LysM protein [Fibrobacterota bacterium]